MIRRPVQIALSLGALGLAGALGAALLTPSSANPDEQKEEKAKIEKRVIRLKHPGREMTREEMESRLSELQDTLREEQADCQDRVAEAEDLLDKAEEALREGDEAVARALINEAGALVGGGDYDFDFDMDFSPGFPFGVSGGPGEAHAFSLGGDNEHEIRIFKHGAGDDAPIVVGGDGATIQLEIENDEWHASGTTKEGKDFDIRGSKDVVTRQLEELGFKVKAIEGRGPHAFGFGSGKAGALGFGDEDHHGKVFSEVFKHQFPFGGNWNGKELSADERKELTEEVARLTAEAHAAFEAGKSDEAMELLTKAWAEGLALQTAHAFAFAQPFGEDAEFEWEGLEELEIELSQLNIDELVNEAIQAAVGAWDEEAFEKHMELLEQRIEAAVEESVGSSGTSEDSDDAEETAREQEVAEENTAEREQHLADYITSV